MVAAKVRESKTDKIADFVIFNFRPLFELTDIQ